jgi:anti-anti-sigma regulatory factor
MTIHIDINSEGPEVIVYLAGRLTGDEATQLISACGSIEGNFVLDLSKLLFADEAGVDVIRTIGEQGAKLHGALPFVQLLIDNKVSKELYGEQD